MKIAKNLDFYESPANIISEPETTKLEVSPLKVSPQVNPWRRWGEKEFAYALSLAYLAFLLIGIWHHEMWRAETQAWLIARDAGSLSHLFELTRREGHPALWYVLLYGLTRLTHDVVALQFLQLFIASASIYIMARFAPFSRLQKILLAFGYFPFFEFGVFARAYSLAVLSLFLYCSLYQQRRRNFIGLVLCLFLLANTSALGILIALSLGASLIWELLRPLPEGEQEGRREDERKLLAAPLIRATKYSAALVAVFVIGGVFFAMKQIAAPGQWEALKYVFSHFNIWLITIPIRAVWESFLPVPQMTEYHFWGTNFLLRDVVEFTGGVFGITDWLICIFTFGFAAGSILIFRLVPRILVTYLLGIGGLLFLILLSRGQIATLRHFGHLFLVLVMCVWLFKSPHFERKKSLQPGAGIINFVVQKRAAAWTLLLALHCVAGFYAWGMDVLFPFSGSWATAEFIREKGLNAALLAGGKASPISPLSAYLDKEIMYLDANRYGSYIAFHRPGPWRNRDKRRVLRNLRALVRRRSRETAILLIFNRPLENRQGEARKKLTPMWQAPEPIVVDERYFLYYVPRANAESTPETKAR